MADKIFADDILQGKVAFVTGGGTGITGGVARAFAKHGAKIAITSRKEENLIAQQQFIEENGGKCFSVAADIRDFDAVQNAIAKTVEHYGRMDIVVNGAAGNFLCAADQLSANGFGTVIDIDTKGTFNVCRASFEALKESKGQILNISATLHYLATPMQIHVSAAKAGVDAITRNLSVEWGRHGIRVNGIAPGPIEDTEAIAPRSSERKDHKEDSTREIWEDRRYRERRSVFMFGCSKLHQWRDFGCRWRTVVVGNQFGLAQACVFDFTF